MQVRFLALFLLAATVSFAADVRLPVLKVGDTWYTNVTITKASATDIYFQHSKGMGNAKLKNLDIEISEVDFHTNDISFFPNPASQSVIVHSSISGNLSIINLIGEEFNSDEKIEVGKSTLDISNLSNGIYLLQIRNQDFYLTKKIVVQGN